MKIAVITGTMPDIIKQAPVVWEAKKRGHSVILIHTNQHYSNDLFLGMYKSVGLRKPDFVLKHRFALGTTIRELTSLFKKTKPDIVLVHGDTKTAMVAAVAAHYLVIPVGHVEAGLRTETREPWPEQTDTRIADACSNLFFAATEKNAKYLRNETFHKDDIVVCGNTVVDIALATAEKNGAKAAKTKKIYFSAHREENMQSEFRFTNIVKFANFLASEGYEVNWVMRLKTKQKIEEYHQELDPKIKKIDHLDYPESIKLLNESAFACVDSGGLQEEASALHIPCMTMRYATDRPETVEIGCNILTTLEFPKMKLAYAKLRKDYEEMKKKKCPYGEGDSAKQIIDFIEKRQDTLIRWAGKI